MAYGIKYLIQNEGGERPEVQALASRGIKGDDTVAHLDTGEIVVPKSAQTPGLMALFAKNMRSKGMDPMTYMVGSKQAKARRNPYTGAQQFYDASTGGEQSTAGMDNNDQQNDDTAGDADLYGDDFFGELAGPSSSVLEDQPAGDSFSQWADVNLLGYKEPRTNKAVREGMGMSMADYYSSGGPGGAQMQSLRPGEISFDGSNILDTAATGITGVLENLWDYATPLGYFTDVELTGKDLFSGAPQPGLYASLPGTSLFGFPSYDIFRGEKVENDSLLDYLEGKDVGIAGIFGDGSTVDYQSLVDNFDSGGGNIEAIYTPTQVPEAAPTVVVTPDTTETEAESPWSQPYVTALYGLLGGPQEEEEVFFPRSYYYSEA